MAKRTDLEDLVVKLQDGTYDNVSYHQMTELEQVNIIEALDFASRNVGN